MLVRNTSGCMALAVRQSLSPLPERPRPSLKRGTCALAPSASAAETTVDQSEDQQEHNGSDERIDDQGNDPDPEVDTEAGHQPVSDERTDQTDEQVADQSEAAALHNPASQITGNNPDDEDDEETLIGEVHAIALLLGLSRGNAELGQWFLC